MQLHDHVTGVTRQLEAAAALGDDRTREIAAALSAAAAPAVRLAVLAAVSAAADEITAALLDAPGSPAVGVRLDGHDAIDLSVQVHLTDVPTGDDPAPSTSGDTGEPSARVSLRLAEALKADVDAAADREGISVNAWLTRAATAALRPNPFAAFGPFAAAMGAGKWAPGNPTPHQRPGDQRITGWING